MWSRVPLDDEPPRGVPDDDRTYRPFFAESHGLAGSAPPIPNEPYARRTSSRLRYSAWPDSLLPCNPNWTAYWLRSRSR
jgi:hypothetical protein